MLYLRGRWKARGVRKRGGKTEKNRVPVVTQERFNKKKSERQSKTDWEFKRKHRSWAPEENLWWRSGNRNGTTVGLRVRGNLVVGRWKLDHFWKPGYEERKDLGSSWWGSYRLPSQPGFLTHRVSNCPIGNSVPHLISGWQAVWPLPSLPQSSPLYPHSGLYVLLSQDLYVYGYHSKACLPILYH